MPAGGRVRVTLSLVQWAGMRGRAEALDCGQQITTANPCHAAPPGAHLLRRRHLAHVRRQVGSQRLAFTARCLPPTDRPYPARSLLPRATSAGRQRRGARRRRRGGEGGGRGGAATQAQHLFGLLVKATAGVSGGQVRGGRS